MQASKQSQVVELQRLVSGHNVAKMKRDDKIVVLSSALRVDLEDNIGSTTFFVLPLADAQKIPPLSTVRITIEVLPPAAERPPEGVPQLHAVPPAAGPRAPQENECGAEPATGTAGGDLAAPVTAPGPAPAPGRPRSGPKGTR